MKKLSVLLLSICLAGPVTAAEEQPTLVNIKRMSMETALAIATAAIEQCRKEGVQVAVTVIDRGGHPQVALRDVLAPDLTLTISRQKAYTAMSFNAATSAMENRFTQPFSVGKVDGLVFSAGGLPIAAGGTILGGVGVSGAPSGATDEKCAKAGIEAVIGDFGNGRFLNSVHNKERTMYLKHKPTGDLVEVLDIRSLVDPVRDKFAGRFHAGEELQDPASFAKSDMIFPSGENLPRAWIDPHYRE